MGYDSGQATLLEDNQATLQILKSGKNPALRHVARTHRVNLAWRSEVFRKSDQMSIEYCRTAEQAADIMTKGFTNPETWKHATALIGMSSRDDMSLAYGLSTLEPPPKPKKSQPQSVSS